MANQKPKHTHKKKKNTNKKKKKHGKKEQKRIMPPNTDKLTIQPEILPLLRNVVGGTCLNVQGNKRETSSMDEAIYIALLADKLITCHSTPERPNYRGLSATAFLSYQLPLLKHVKCCLTTVISIY